MEENRKTLNLLLKYLRDCKEQKSYKEKRKAEVNIKRTHEYVTNGFRGVILKVHAKYSSSRALMSGWQGNVDQFNKNGDSKIPLFS